MSASRARLVAAAFAAALAYALCAAWLGGPPFVLGALVAGGLAAVLTRSVRTGCWTGASAGALGGALTLWYVDAALTTQRITHMPAYATQDAPPYLFGNYANAVMQHNVANIYFADGLGRLAFVLIACLSTGAVSAALAAVLSRRPALRKTAARLLVALLVVMFVLTAWAGRSATLRTRIAHRPAPGTYDYDAHVYLAAYYDMAHTDYYHSLLSAASGDKRVRAEHGVVDGKFRTWGYPPVLVRQPWAFWLWRLVPGGAIGVLALAVGLEALVLWLLYAGFERFVGVRAALVPIVLLPLSLLRVASIIVFTPDHWASVAVLLSLAAVLRRRFVTAGALALAASLFRETAVLWLVALLGIAVVLAWRRRGAWPRIALAYALALGAFAVAFGLHLHAAQALAYAPAPAGSLVQSVMHSAARPLVMRFISPAAYLMFPYGFYLLPPWLFLFAQLPGLAIGIRRDVEVRAFALGFALLWLVYTLTIGVSSSYWGVLYVPFGVAATALLFATALPAEAEAAPRAVAPVETPSAA